MSGVQTQSARSAHYESGEFQLFTVVVDIKLPK